MIFRGGEKKRNKALALIVISFLLGIFYIDSSVQGTAWSLLPPLLAISVSLVSGQLILSLGSAVLLGGFLSSYGQSGSLATGGVETFKKTFGHFYSAGTDSSNLQILGFVFLILSMVHVLTVAGGLHALVKSLQRWIVGPRSAQLVTALLGCVIFIDDYANTMIVGSTMKRVTDRYKISREKLAFIVDSTSAPIAGVALVSTWVGYEVGLFSEMSAKFGWPVDGYSVFLDAIGFRFYCFFMLIFVFVNIAFGLDFGPMRNARPKVASKEDLEIIRHNSHPLMAVLPLFSLVALVFTLLWADGGGFNSAYSVFNAADWRAVLVNSKNGISILLLSAISSYLLSIVLAFFWIGVDRETLLRSFVLGVKSTWLPVVILLLAWSVKLVCDDLQTGEFIVSQLGDRVTRQWLPVTVFLVSALTAFATGTSWGTMAILIPTVTPLAVEVAGGEYGIFVSLCLAAILDGSIMGDHCSPISDTTIMSSISSDCDLLNHVKTQLPYTLTVGILSIMLGYLPASFNVSTSLSFAVYIAIVIGLFFLLKRYFHLKEARL